MDFSPELRHPVPTHPAYIPEPPSTPTSPHGYQRFSSSSSPAPQQQQQQQHIPAYPQPQVPPPPQQFTSPFQHAQGNPPPNQHGHQPGLQPDFGAWGMNDATAQIGMQLGSSAFAAGQEYMQRNFGSIIPGSYSLKHHFNVSNSYVLNKLRVVLFPWTHKPWSRRIRRSDQAVTEWQPPREDINAPDLYIPAMAVVTYILISAVHKGIRGGFHASVLGDTASRALIVILCDFLFIKLGCFLLNVQGTSQVADLVAYGGYKFVGVIATLVFEFLQFRRSIWLLVFVYCFLANGFFLLRSLRTLVLPPSDQSSSTAGSGTTHRRRRITFLFLEAVTQVLWMGVLVRI